MGLACRGVCIALGLAVTSGCSEAAPSPALPAAAVSLAATVAPPRLPEPVSSGPTLRLPLLAAKRPVSVRVGGHAFVDPYAWLGDPGDEATKWLTEQDAFASDVLGRVPTRARVADRLRELAPSLSAVRAVAIAKDEILVLRSSGFHEGPIHLEAAKPGGVPRALPLHLGPDATFAHLLPSPDGRLVAVAALSAGSEGIGPVEVLEIESGRSLDILRAARIATLDWTPDGKALVHATPGSVYRHVLGGQGDDAQIFGGPREQQFVWGAEYTRAFVGKRETVVYVVRHLEREKAVFSAYHAPTATLASPKPPWRPVVVPRDVHWLTSTGDLVVLGRNGDQPWTVAVLDPAQAGAKPRALTSASAARGPWIALSSDALYYWERGDLHRVPLAGGADEDLETPPSAAQSLLADRWHPGAHVYAHDCTTSAIYAYGPRDRHLHVVPTAGILPTAERLELREVTTAGQAIRVIGARDARPGPRPLRLVPSPCPDIPTNAVAWFEAGGLDAYCSMTGPAFRAASGDAAQSQLILECAHRLVDEHVVTRELLALDASRSTSGAAIAAALAEPDVFRALIVTWGTFDGGASRDPAAGIAGSPGTVAGFVPPYFRLEGAKLPLVLVQTRLQEPPTVSQGARLAARLAAVEERRAAALLTVRGLVRAGPSSRLDDDIADEADDEAFLRWQLLGEGRQNMPALVRAPTAR